MTNAKEYILLKGKYPLGLEEQINAYLSDGWELYGNPFTAEQDGISFIFQAVIHKLDQTS